MLKYKYKQIWLTGAIVGFGIGLLPAIVKVRKQLSNERRKADKYLELYKVMGQWIEAAQNEQFMAEWLRQNKYTTVGIYGMSLIGERLYVELMDRGIQVAYGIDRLSRDYLDGIKVYKPDAELPQVDAIIVTAVSDYKEIKEQLEKKVKCPVLSFRDILDELLIQ